jgi:hypothetical protein
VDPGYRGVESDNPDVQIVHRAKSRRISELERKLLRLSQVIEPLIGHLKMDHSMDRCHLKGETGDRLHAVLCVAGYNIWWLLRMIAKKKMSFSQHICLRRCVRADLWSNWSRTLRTWALCTSRRSDACTSAMIRTDHLVNGHVPSHFGPGTYLSFRCWRYSGFCSPFPLI